jgi:hypothetical protein
MQSNDTLLAGDVVATKTILAIYKKTVSELLTVKEGSFTTATGVAQYNWLSKRN